MAVWLASIEEIGIETIVVIGPDPFGSASDRIVVAIYPDIHIHNATLLAAGESYGAKWRAVNSPLVAWQNLSNAGYLTDMSWALPWLEVGMLSVVRVEIPLPLGRGFECFLFAGQQLMDRAQAEAIAWRTMSAWPVFKQEVLSHRFDISPRELEAIRHTAEGATAAQTGAAMGVSTRTAQFHLNNAMNKLHAENRVAAIMRACWCGIV